MAAPRKDRAQLETNGEVTEKAAAAILGKTSATLATWRKLGFAKQPFAPKSRGVHKRLVAYVKSEVELLKRVLAGEIGLDHPDVAAIL